MLVRYIDKEEIREALRNCASFQSLGPDGFNFGFSKFCWEEIKDDLTKIVHSFAESSKWLRGRIIHSFL